MLRITGGAREKGKPHMQWMGDIESVTGLSINDLNQLMKDRKKWKLLVSNIVKKRKWTNIFNPRSRQRQTTPLIILPSASARITRSLTDSTDFSIVLRSFLAYAV